MQCLGIVLSNIQAMFANISFFNQLYLDMRLGTVYISKVLKQTNQYYL